MVLSPAFLAGRRWTTLELNGLFAAQKRVLPVFHQVTPEEVAQHSPILADRKGIVAERESIAKLVEIFTQFLRTV